MTKQTPSIAILYVDPNISDVERNDLESQLKEKFTNYIILPRTTELMVVPSAF